MVAGRTLRSLRLALLAAVLVSCGDDPTGPSSNFLIHSPADNPDLATVAALLVSPSSTDSVLFAWEPAPRATRYEIAFWRAESREEMMLYRADLGKAPTLRIPVDDPALAQVPVNPARPDGPTTPMVTHRVRIADFDGALRLAGLEASGPYFFVWSVYAEAGGRRVRSIERHRMVLLR